MIFQILQQNALWLFIIGLIVFIAWGFIKFSKSSSKPVSREQIEHDKFIERMKVNTNQSTSKFLYRGNQNLGSITHARNFVTEGNPHNYLICEMVVKPTLFWKFINPMAKPEAFQVNIGYYDEEKHFKSNIIEDVDKLIVPSWISFNYYFGIYYDITIAREHQDIILKKDLALTDLTNEKSIDFAKAQELSIIGYSPFAFEMAKKEKDIQHEMAKKKGEQQSI